MKIHHVPIFLLSAVCGVSAQANVFTGTEGRSVTLTCHLTLSGSRRSFCKGDCSKDNILIETRADKAHNEKYTTEYYGSWMSSGSLIVTIRQLTKSDAGRYRCSMSSPLDSYTDVVLVVKDGFFVPLVSCGVLIALLLTIVLLILYQRKSKRNIDGLNTGGDTGKNIEFQVCPSEIHSPPATCEYSIYQSLDPASKDQDQIYSTLTFVRT